MLRLWYQSAQHKHVPILLKFSSNIHYQWYEVKLHIYQTIPSRIYIYCLSRKYWMPCIWVVPNGSYRPSKVQLPYRLNSHRSWNRFLSSPQPLSHVLWEALAVHPFLHHGFSRFIPSKFEFLLLSLLILLPRVFGSHQQWRGSLILIDYLLSPSQLARFGVPSWFSLLLLLQSLAISMCLTWMQHLQLLDFCWQSPLQ